MNRKLYIPLIIAALVFIVWKVNGEDRKNTPGPQTWEYKTIVIVRPAKSNAEWSDWGEISGETVKALPPPVSVSKKMKELGEEGWELVSVTAISNNSGGSGTSGYADLAGFTSQLNYWFKRSK
jgi:hypothetical protein